MTTLLGHYLENLRSNLRLAPSAEKEVINELATHIEDRPQELTASGLSDAEAARTCIGLWLHLTL